MYDSEQKTLLYVQEQVIRGSNVPSYPDYRNLEKVTFGNGDEYAYRDGGNDERTTESLKADCVLNLAESWLLDPNLTVKNFTNDISFFVFGNPWLVFVTITRAHGVE